MLNTFTLLICYWKKTIIINNSQSDLRETETKTKNVEKKMCKVLHDNVFESNNLAISPYIIDGWKSRIFFNLFYKI